MQKSWVWARWELSSVWKFGVHGCRLFPAWQGSEDNSERAGALHQTPLKKGGPSAEVSYVDLKSNSRAKYPCVFLMLSRLLGTAWGYLEKTPGGRRCLRNLICDLIAWNGGLTCVRVAWQLNLWKPSLTNLSMPVEQKLLSSISHFLPSP